MNDNVQLNKQELSSWLKEKKTLAHFVVTFSINMTQTKSLEYLNVLYRMINHEYIKGKKNKKEFINMFAFKEERSDKSTHYHILVNDHITFKAKRNINKNIESVIRDKCSKIKTKIRNKTYNPIHPKHGINFQNYYEGNLESYLLKQLEKNPFDFDFIGVCDGNGFMFGKTKTDKSMAMFKN